MGKTALTHHFHQRARAVGARVLSATGARGEASLPLGVVQQLFDNVSPACLADDRAQRLLESAGLLISMSPTAHDGTGRAMDASLARLVNELLRLVNRQPVVITVDDFDQVDVASARCLLLTLERLARMPVLLLVTATAATATAGTHADLLGDPSCRQLRLGPLSADGAARMLDGHVRGPVDAATAEEFRRVSGGNPLLLTALITDTLQRHGPDSRRPFAGPDFGEALLECLDRGDPAALQLARAVAVLGDLRHRSALLRLARLEPAAADEAIASLAALGLLAGDRLAHPAARSAMLRRVIAEEGPQIHWRAARLLHEEGAPATDIARQLLAAERVPEPWSFPVLRQAARRSFNDGDLELSARQLELAHLAGSDDRERLNIRAVLACTEWQVAPASGARHLPELAAAAVEGPLGTVETLVTAQQLLWHGHFDKAVAALKRAMAIGRRDPRTAEQLNLTAQWLAYACPALGRRLRATGGDGRRGRGESAAGRDRREPMALLASVLTGRGGAGLADRCERVLESSHRRTLHPVSTAAALMALLYDCRENQVSSWSVRIREAVGERLAPTWRGLFAAIGAESALRLGDLRSAERETRTALSLVSPESWGTVVGAPLATGALTALAAGRPEEARAWLSRPVPPTTFQTPFGLHFLHARGRYYAATDRPHAALVDFHMCGDLMRTWDMDVPGLAPWRSEAAQVYAALGRTSEARLLAEEQVRMVGDRRCRTRGLSLLALAAASELPDRLDLLREAADVLEHSGSKVDLIRALNDEAAAHQVVGNNIQARMMTRQAREVAEECGIRQPPRRPLPEHTAAKPVKTTAPRPSDGKPTPKGGVPGPGPGALTWADLSEAERRVASLAARGFTNREISDRLSVTVSTVEQHLTRAYRKLRIRRRVDLPERVRALADHT
jgi:DNA-binding CsgD family transcriptional regulator